MRRLSILLSFYCKSIFEEDESLVMSYMKFMEIEIIFAVLDNRISFIWKKVFHDFL